LPWTKLSSAHLVKDVGLFPEYFKNEYGLSAEIVFTGENETQQEFFHGIKLTALENNSGISSAPKVRDFFKFLKFLKIFKNYLKADGNQISYLMMFHITSYTWLLSKYARRINPKIKIFVKSDADSFSRQGWIYFPEILKIADMVSVETEDFANSLLKKFPGFSKKIFYVPDGFDDASQEYRAEPKKENLILSCARFGTYPKNTELLLEIFSRVDLKNFKVVFAGSVEKKFQDYIDSFFEKNPHLTEKIKFIGNVSDRKKIYDLYTKSKIFVITSRFESFCIALMEAAFFGNAIISTDVGCAKDIKKIAEKYVHIFPRNFDSDSFYSLGGGTLMEAVNRLQFFIDHDDAAQMDSKTREKIMNLFSMSRIVKSDCFRNFFSQGSALHEQ
jgi:glycosyltransferase involved in cell wall biosynthesis